MQTITKTTRLLGCDLDGTLIPFKRTPGYEHAITTLHQQIASDPSITLAYLTGRDHSLALEGISQFKLPKPHYLVTDVGTTIHLLDGNRYTRDDEYHKLFGRSLSEQLNETALQEIPGLRLQEPDKQSEWKRSYYLAPKDAQRIQQAVHDILGTAQSSLDIIYSVDAHDCGLLDIVPRGISKASALHYLQKKLSLKQREIVYAGDSGNDYNVFIAGYPSIVVANAYPSVVNELKRQEHLHESLFFATKDCAEGVIEGCQYFKLF